MWVPMYAVSCPGVPVPRRADFNVAKVRNSFESEVKAIYFGITCHFIAIIYYSFTF